MGKVRTNNGQIARIASAVIATLSLCYQAIVHADPAAKVLLPTVVQGELEFELLGGSQRWRNHDGDRERQFIGEIGYGLTDWWKTELGVGTTRFPSQSYRLDEVEWENIFALTEPGQYWLDLALLAEFARDYGAGLNAIKIGPMFQTQFGPVQSNLNLLFERELGAEAEPGALINYQWQLKWRGNPRFEPGLQGFGTLGRTTDFGHLTESRIGPALFGQIVTSPRHKLKYDAAVLFGLTNNTAATTVRFEIEYEMN
jgi:hypothetical protein